MSQNSSSAAAAAVAATELVTAVHQTPVENSKLSKSAPPVQRLCDRAHPLVDASLFSNIYLTFLSPLFALGKLRPLSEHDFWPSAPQDEVKFVTEKLLRQWVEQLKLPAGSLKSAIFSAFKYRFIATGVAEFCHFAFYGLIPFTVSALSKWSTHPSDDRTLGSSQLPLGVAFALGIGFLCFVASTLINNKFIVAYRGGSQIKSALMSMIYQKSLRLSASARSHMTLGATVNLMSHDCATIYESVPFYSSLFTSIVVICVVLGLLLWKLGLAAVATMFLLLLMIPLQSYNGRKLAFYKRDILTFTDRRVKLMTEILSGIRIIKFYAWEIPFADKIHSIRAAETNRISRSLLLKSINVGILIAWPSLVSFVTLAVYSSLGNTVDTETVLYLLAQINMLRVPFNLLPQAIGSLSETKISLKRIETFLRLPEINSTVKLNCSDHEECKSTGSIRIMNGEFRWDPAAENPILKSINISVKPGELIGIIGSVGSGKSSLIAGLLGEMSVTPDTEVCMRGRVAYMSQKAWIRNETVRNNILFGLPFDVDRYWRCIRAAGLEPDLSILTGGDLTEIGESGINLSGGQKSRVTMARALYRAPQTDIYLLDDPFSALDINTGKLIWDDGIMKMLKGKTRIICLNSHLHLATACNRIIVLQKSEGNQANDQSDDQVRPITRNNTGLASVRDYAAGELSGPATIVAEGDYDQISQQFPNLMQAQEEYEEKANVNVIEFNARSSVKSPAGPTARGSVQSPSSPSAAKLLNPNNDLMSEKIRQDKSSLVQKETRAVGSVGFSVYRDYFRAASPSNYVPILFLLFIYYGVGQVTRMGADLMSTIWGAKQFNLTDTQYIWVYAIWVFAALFVTVTRALSWTSYAVRASQNLHDSLFRKMLRAPITTFYDVIPTGRILSRFTKDCELIDLQLPSAINDCAINCLSFVGTIVLAIIVTPYFIVAFIPIVLLFRWVLTYFSPTNRSLKLLESISRSPIFSIFSESLQGLQSIRAYGQTQKFIDETERLMQKNSKCFLAAAYSERWLSVRLEYVTMLVVAAVCLFTALMRDALSPSLAGLAIVYTLQMCGLLQYTVRLTAVVGNNMTAVERLTEYSKVDSEAPFSIPETIPSQNWPSQGRIEFVNLKMRYRPELDLVLKGISFVVEPGESVGICGRTGSEKSSLLIALFRICEAAEGSILIDGVDISRLGLTDLRSRMSIIPQDAVCFAGELARNLDPFDDRTEEELWAALEQVQLANSIRELPDGLKTRVAEGGENFSHGQRQLICFARALLRNTRILVCDEATASLSVDAALQIQKTIRTCFASRTILTIAHRLESIIEGDKILVLDAGKVVEFDRPINLLNSPNGIFRKLVEQSGDTNVKTLISLAEQHEAEMKNH